jgi:hypothetical protein
MSTWPGIPDGTAPELLVGLLGHANGWVAFMKYGIISYEGSQRVVMCRDMYITKGIRQWVNCQERLVFYCPSYHPKYVIPVLSSPSSLPNALQRRFKYTNFQESASESQR